MKDEKYLYKYAFFGLTDRLSDKYLYINAYANTYRKSSQNKKYLSVLKIIWNPHFFPWQF